MHALVSLPPRVKLTKAFTTPFDNAVATARTCYSSRIIYDEDVRKDDASKKLRNDISRSIYIAGHHTTLQHAHFQFAVENISRHAIWSFFHAHPFYNSEQVSQRYVEVRPDRVLIPKFDDGACQERYETAVKRQMATYKQLLTLLLPAATTLYFSIYPARKKSADDKRWQSAIKKRCQEVARYVLPVATHTHLYHTISALTLHRYNRLANMYECPLEQRLTINAMVSAVEELDPLFTTDMEDSVPLVQTHEAKHFADWLGLDKPKANAHEFVRDFDASLEGRVSKLVACTSSPIEVLGDALRQIFGESKRNLTDEMAIQLLLNPQKNGLLGESLNLLTLGKASRALELVHFTFRKKISHGIDLQVQRHRMTPGARPILWTHVIPGVPDYITPELFLHPEASEAKAIYDAEMTMAFNDIAFLTERGVSPLQWQYLIPNAFPVRYTDTGSLLDHHHKWTARLCYNAQEEVWRSALDEVTQVEALHPDIGKWLLPPCGLRSLAQNTPVCPEGQRFCGVPVWRLSKKDYVRII
jgi:flavin-dependent thymidylate synthase